jgi:hypothetical protein
MTVPDEMTEQQSANSSGRHGGRFPPGQTGNRLGRPDRRRGEDIVRTLVDRLVPPRKDRLVAFALPALHTAADAAKPMASLTAAVASGALTASEATELTRLVEAFTKALEAADFETRLAALEQRMGTMR